MAEVVLGLLCVGEWFDLVFIDVCLGELNGIDVVYCICIYYLGLLVLVIFGFDLAEVIGCLCEGIYFLFKLYLMSELFDVICICFGVMEIGCVV